MRSHSGQAEATSSCAQRAMTCLVLKRRWPTRTFSMCLGCFSTGQVGLFSYLLPRRSRKVGSLGEEIRYLSLPTSLQSESLALALAPPTSSEDLSLATSTQGCEAWKEQTSLPLTLPRHALPLVKQPTNLPLATTCPSSCCLAREERGRKGSAPALPQMPQRQTLNA